MFRYLIHSELAGIFLVPYLSPYNNIKTFHPMNQYGHYAGIIYNRQLLLSLSNILVCFTTITKLLFRCVFTPMPNPKAGGPSSARSTWLLIQYIQIYPLYLQDVTSYHNLRMRHAMVTRNQAFHTSKLNNFQTSLCVTVETIVCNFLWMMLSMA
jgi:hypothetical protein